MSRTDKDVPHWVWEVRAVDRRAVHGGCVFDGARDSRGSVLGWVESRSVVWEWTPGRVVVTSGAVYADEDGWPVRWATARTRWVYEPVVTVVWAPVRGLRDCGLEGRDRTALQVCGWVSPSYRRKRGSKRGARARFHRAERARTRSVLRAVSADWNTFGDTDAVVPVANFRYPWWD